jgi:hypothetical protein
LSEDPEKTQKEWEKISNCRKILIEMMEEYESALVNVA